jgi:CRISPR-associated protein Cas5t
MKIYRIHLSSWTASFRYPNMITAFQPTLPVPPLSCINGLISAAMGKYFVVTTEKIGYFFNAKGKHIDLETIYQMGRGLTGIKSNVIKREFLFETDLFLYTDSSVIAHAFISPVFPLLLGRSGDLARVHGVSEIDRQEETKLTQIRGTIVPFMPYQLPAAIQALPVCFTNDLPRRNIGTRPYSLLPANYPDQVTHEIKAAGFHDTVSLDEKSISLDVYWQEI